MLCHVVAETSQLGTAIVAGIGGIVVGVLLGESSLCVRPFVAYRLCLWPMAFVAYVLCRLWSVSVAMAFVPMSFVAFVLHPWQPMAYVRPMPCGLCGLTTLGAMVYVLCLPPLWPMVYGLFCCGLWPVAYGLYAVPLCPCTLHAARCTLRLRGCTLFTSVAHTLSFQPLRPHTRRHA